MLLMLQNSGDIAFWIQIDGYVEIHFGWKVEIMNCVLSQNSGYISCYMFHMSWISCDWTSCSVRYAHNPCTRNIFEHMSCCLDELISIHLRYLRRACQSLCGNIAGNTCGAKTRGRIITASHFCMEWWRLYREMKTQQWKLESSTNIFTPCS